jgi:phage baseplate assembly protein W
MTDDTFGSDILLDENRQAVVAANGELVWCDGITAAVQDITLRVYTYLGGLFYDREFGSTIPLYIHEEGTKVNRLSLAAEVQRRIQMDVRVRTGSVTARILAWDEKSITVEADWMFWDTEEPQNLTVTLSRPGRERVVEDINAGED